MDFLEKYKVNVARCTTGNTAVQYSPYYDMLGVKHADFFLQGVVMHESSITGSAVQLITAGLYQASNSTGGGSSAISSATAAGLGKSGTATVTTSAKLVEGAIGFSTISGSAALSIRVGTAAYVSASVGAAAAAMTWVAGASVAATVAAQAFVTMFNSTVYNTSTVIRENFYAATNVAGSPWIRILRKNPDSTNELSLIAPSTLVSVGGVVAARLGISDYNIKDGKRYVAIGVNSSQDESPYSVVCIREMYDRQNYYNNQGTLKNLSTISTGWGPA